MVDPKVAADVGRRGRCLLVSSTANHKWMSLSFGVSICDQALLQQCLSYPGGAGTSKICMQSTRYSVPSHKWRCTCCSKFEDPLVTPHSEASAGGMPNVGEEHLPRLIAFTCEHA